MRHAPTLLALAAIATVAVYGISGCNDQPTHPDQPANSSQQFHPLLKPTLATPTIQVVDADEHTLTVRFTAGASGAPAGFSLQWERKSDYDTYGWASGEYSYCAASFAGNANGSRYALSANSSVDVVVGVDEYTGAGESGGCGELECGTEYAFRAFAHANSSSNRSAFTSTIFGSTDDCPSTASCILGFGIWKQGTGWPSGHATTDAFFSTGKTWLSMLNTAPAGDKAIIAAQDYIETKLDICNGANPNAAILSALSDVYDYFNGTLSLTNAQLQSLHNTLTSERHNMTCDGDGTYCP
jgi:hypothetical protein